jgi:hypothetical protein
MRVSSLSDERIISLVSRYFVPVWISRDRYQLDPPSKAERELLARIDADRHRKRLEGGSVCVYIVTADGEALATMTVQRAWKPEVLAPFLRKFVTDRKLNEREEKVVKARALTQGANPPRSPADKNSRMFCVRTRFDTPGANRGTSRDRVELTKAEWSSFVAPGGVKAGDSWTISRAAAEKLLRHAYPPLPSWDARLAKLRGYSLTATVVGPSGGETLARLEGNLDLIYPHKGQPTDGRQTARLIGYVRYDGRGALTSLQLVSEGGQYVWYWQEKRQPPRATSLAVELEP